MVCARGMAGQNGYGCFLEANGFSQNRYGGKQERGGRGSGDRERRGRDAGQRGVMQAFFCIAFRVYVLVSILLVLCSVLEPTGYCGVLATAVSESILGS